MLFLVRWIQKKIYTEIQKVVSKDKDIWKNKSKHKLLILPKKWIVPYKNIYLFY